MPVDGLGDVRGPVADGVANVLDRKPLLLIMDTAVYRPSCACQRPIPARLVIMLNRQLSASLLYWRPCSWHKTRLVS